MRRLVGLFLLLLVVHPLGAQEPLPAFMVEATLDVTRAYPDEAVLYTVTAYSDTARDVSFVLPAFEGFWQGGTRALRGSATISGKQYSTLVYQVSLYPQRVGTIEIAPARAQFAATVFSDGAVYDSPPVRLEVVPLPPSPVDFSGLVGGVVRQFEAEPRSVRIGEPIDITLRMEGAANLMQMPLPELIAPDGWRLYPEPRQQSADFEGDVLMQRRIYRWRAIPDQAGRAALILPPLVYFTAERGYHTLESITIDFEILAGEGGQLRRDIPTLAGGVLAAALPQTAPSAAPPVAWLIGPAVAAALLISRRARSMLYERARSRRRTHALVRAVTRLRGAAESESGLTLIEAAIHDYFADHERPIPQAGPVADVLLAVESARYMPDGDRHTGALARRAADVLRAAEEAGR